MPVEKRDLAKLSEATLTELARGWFWRPVKEQVVARIDADVLTRLKAGGKG